LHNQMVRPVIFTRSVKIICYFWSPYGTTKYVIRFRSIDYKFWWEIAIELELILPTLIRVTILVL
jgi:hypothetical protein